jgi:hypothetical protein
MGCAWPIRVTQSRPTLVIHHPVLFQSMTMRFPHTQSPSPETPSRSRAGTSPTRSLGDASTARTTHTTTPIGPSAFKYLWVSDASPYQSVFRIRPQWDLGEWAPCLPYLFAPLDLACLCCPAGCRLLEPYFSTCTRLPKQNLRLEAAIIEHFDGVSKTSKH